MTIKNKNLEQELIRESIFIIGHVLSVDGRIVRIGLNKNKNPSHILYKGKTVKNISVGSYVKITKGFINIIGKVEGEYISSEEEYFNKEYSKEESKINRILKVSLFGHFEGNVFKQGIKEMPLIDNECFILNKDEFNILHQFYESDDKKITIGNLTEEPSQKIQLGVNNLFASHIGIFGNTGSGKSYTLAKIYSELFNEYTNNDEFKKKSDFVIIDFNGEYVGDKMITEDKEVYKLSTREDGSEKKYPISKEHLNKTDVLSVLLEATEKTQKPFLDWAIRKDYLDDQERFNERVISNIEEICKNIIDKKDKNLREGVILDLFTRISGLVVSESENTVNELRRDIEDNLHLHVGNDYFWGISTSKVYNDSAPIYDTNIKSRIDTLVFKNDEINVLKLKIILGYFHAIIKGFYNQEHIGPLIGRMTRKFRMLEKLVEIKDDEETSKNLIILSLREVNIEMKKTIPLIVCKQLYEKKKDSRDKTSLHIIIDEAHTILSTMSQRESEIWKDYRLETFEEIIKEGRKFGVFLTIASQRPYDISQTIISQLHNYFIHRLINDNDINAVEKAVSYLDRLSFQTIPILPIGSCFVAGLASDISVKVDIGSLEEDHCPESGTVNLENSWVNGSPINGQKAQFRKKEKKKNLPLKPTKPKSVPEAEEFPEIESEK